MFWTCWDSSWRTDLWKLLQHKLILTRQLTLNEWLAMVEAWWVSSLRLAFQWASYERLLSSSNPNVMIVASSS